MKIMQAVALALAVVAAISVQFAAGAVPSRCKSYFQLLELQSPNGPRHTPFDDVFDADSREINGQPMPQKLVFAHNKIYKGCGTDFKTPAIRPGARAGIQQGHCVETYAPLKFIECYLTWVLPEGTISCSGPMDLTKGTGILTVTGGTGKYFAAKGEISMEFGYAFPSKCNVPADLKSSVSTYTFCLDQPSMTV